MTPMVKINMIKKMPSINSIGAQKKGGLIVNHWGHRSQQFSFRTYDFSAVQWYLSKWELFPQILGRKMDFWISFSSISTLSSNKTSSSDDAVMDNLSVNKLRCRAVMPGPENCRQCDLDL